MAYFEKYNGLIFQSNASILFGLECLKQCSASITSFHCKYLISFAATAISPSITLELISSVEITQLSEITIKNCYQTCGDYHLFY